VLEVVPDPDPESSPDFRFNCGRSGSELCVPPLEEAVVFDEPVPEPEVVLEAESSLALRFN
jgi:hypothetical protein